MPPALIQRSAATPAAPVGADTSYLAPGGQVLDPWPTDVRRESRGIIYYKPRAELRVDRVNDVTAPVVVPAQLPPEPIIRSLFDPGRTRKPANAFTLARFFPDSATWEDDSFASDKVQMVPGADAPKGGFMDWAGLRRNRNRDTPESYGDIVSLADDPR